MKIFKSILVLAMVLCFISPAMAASQLYFTVVWDDNSGDAFISDLYRESTSADHNANYKRFVNVVKDGHAFYCSGCYSGGTIRGGSEWSASDNVRDAAIEKFETKGYTVHQISWEP